MVSIPRLCGIYCEILFFCEHSLVQVEEARKLQEDRERKRLQAELDRKREKEKFDEIREDVINVSAILLLSGIISSIFILKGLFINDNLC